MQKFVPRRLLTYLFVTAGLVATVSLAPAAEAVHQVPGIPVPVLNLETLTGLQAEQMMADGKLTSVELTNAYIARIAALNKQGPGLNAVTQMNPDALAEAMKRVAGDREGALELGKRGRKRAEERFEIGKQMGMVLEVLKSRGQR